jgi:hypothetical protein
MKRLGLIVAICLPLGVAGSLGLARALARPRPGPWGARVVFNVIGPQAAARPLPAKTPHDRPWPPARQASEYASFGHRRQITWHTDSAGQTSHQIKVNSYGWPLACTRVVQFWWPWSDPAWATRAAPGPTRSVRWGGLAVDSLALGLPLAAIVYGSFWIRFWIVHRRIRPGLCPRCAYPIGSSAVCTECGKPVRAPPGSSTPRTNAVPDSTP